MTYLNKCVRGIAGIAAGLAVAVVVLLVTLLFVVVRAAVGL